MMRLAGLTVVLSVLVGGATARADKTFNEGKGATWDCAKDPDVTINTSSGTYTLKGACRDVGINGSSLKVTIDSVEDLTINGGKNTVTAGEVDEVDINGNDNTLSWKTALRPGEKPDIQSLGTGNKVTGAAATATAKATATTTTTTTAAPSDATVLDCSTQKTVTIKNGNGTYRVTGTCDKIALSGSHNTVEIEAVKNLSVTGGGNTVIVGKVDKVAVMGAKNTVSYGAGLSVKTPKVASTGKANTIAKTAAGATVTVTAGSSTSTATVGAGSISANASATAAVIDCAKTASHTIDKNNGNYTFTGACDTIRINGNDNNVNVASAKTVHVTGNRNNVAAVAVDSLAVPGNENSVSWKQGLTGAKAKLSVSGDDNRVGQTK